MKQRLLNLMFVTWVLCMPIGLCVVDWFTINAIDRLDHQTADIYTDQQMDIGKLAIITRDLAVILKSEYHKTQALENRIKALEQEVFGKRRPVEQSDGLTVD